MNDEYLKKKVYKILSRQYYFFILLIIVSATLKVIFVSHDYKDYIIEFFTVFVSIGYFLITLKIKNINLLKSQDKYLEEIVEKTKAYGFIIELFCYLIGEFTYFFIMKRYTVAVLYLPVWFIPTLISNINISKSGFMTSGTKKNKAHALKILKLQTAIGSVIFGLCLCGKDIYYNNTIHLDGILWTLYTSIAFGFLFYFCFRLVVDKNDSKWKGNKNL